MTRTTTLLALTATSVLSVAVLSCQRSGETPFPQQALGEPSYAGRQTCVACHQGENEAWSGSHHDLAMQEATVETVFGDFDEATFEYGAVTSRFTQRDGKFFVNTDGPDGQLTDYEIRYTFGVDPLQQYLIEFPDGRVQALNIVWDTRAADNGGQRWFHLYPDEAVDHEDPFHWTKRFQNWNFMCAECHSTRVRKNYQFDENRFETEWFEMDVSCEGCHGPGSNHVAWAESERDGESEGENTKGLVASLKDEAPGQWLIDSASGLATRSPARQSHAEIETCARCHARRSVLSEDYVHGKALADTHRPALLDENLYYPDGQILEEVYVYGSFLQSKMHHKGVSCKDCHEPHSLQLKGSGNALCSGCHLADKFDSSSHHFHPQESEGAACVACHMPARNYMVVDARRDHSFRVPRPDLTTKIGVPNACNGCHVDRPVDWAVAAVSDWYPNGRSDERHYGEALHAARSSSPDAGPLLREVMENYETPGIVRATLLRELPAFLGPDAIGFIRDGLVDSDPLVRFGAVQASEAIGPDERTPLLTPLLRDPILSVRLSAGRSLAGLPNATMSPAERQDLTTVLEEYRSAQELILDRPESHLNLGVLETQLGEPDAAEASYRRALLIDDSIPQAYINLADLYRLQQREQEGERALREGLSKIGEGGVGAAELHHALGLLLVRLRRLPEALEHLRLAALAGPEQPRFAYVYAVALHGTGEVDRAIETLRQSEEKFPADTEILLGLISFLRDSGRIREAIVYANKLVNLRPTDPSAVQVLRQLESLR